VEGFDVGEWGLNLDVADAVEELNVEEDDFGEGEGVQPVCQRGDVWQLGNHRLMCGDSTSAEDVDKLMNGETADMWLTDPPYNVNLSDKVEAMNEYMKNIGEYKLGGIETANLCEVYYKVKTLRLAGKSNRQFNKLKPAVCLAVVGQSLQFSLCHIKDIELEMFVELLSLTLPVAMFVLLIATQHTAQFLIAYIPMKDASTIAVKTACRCNEHVYAGSVFAFGFGSHGEHITTILSEIKGYLGLFLGKNETHLVSLTTTLRINNLVNKVRQSDFTFLLVLVTENHLLELLGQHLHVTVCVLAHGNIAELELNRNGVGVFL
jgi:hypothetical protein